ncbi:MAG: helicase associated domain-containing protein, partial [Verrucomicrobiaceae bacterium]|nr:helicase associated domain-containing protein [Verrucomicrobiaceae bacterium]
AFAREHGHTNVTRKQNKVLGHWRDVQREFRRKGKLSAERVARLEEIGFEWVATEMAWQDLETAQARLWEEKLERLRAFHARFGHTQVPEGWPEDPPLATWVSRQRWMKKRGRLLKEREAHLEALGFDWQPVKARTGITQRRYHYPQKSQERWDRMYGELAAFHARHGHCVVPNNQPEVHALSKWCYSQRHFRRAGKLRADRVARLDALGFRWDATEVPGLSYAERHDLLWEQSFTRLVAFHAKHGHAHVPAHWSEDVELGRWADKQRQKARKGRLQAEKRARLDALGFPWQPGNAPVLKARPPQNFPKPAHEKVWLRHLEDLRAFHEEHGHFRVPPKMGELSRWCKAQRKEARRGKLTPGRRAALEALGFAVEV